MGQDAHVSKDVHITPSVLDRLLEFNPGVVNESHTEDLQQYKQSVRRDLEWLLNTRRVVERLPPEHKELNRSLAAYGLPDFSDEEVNHSPEGVCRAIELSIRTFEPRLREVSVALVAKGAGERERALIFSVEAQLRVEPVVFRTTITLDSGAYTVGEDD